jgi:diguanylate cyclase (GGDEF)-like protein
MMLSAFTLFASAAVLLAIGMTGGWLLRGLISARSADKNSRDSQTGNAALSISEGFVGQTSPRPEVTCSNETQKALDREASAPCVRKTFALALSHRLSESARRGDPISLILARIDNFERLAARHGIQSGNEVLEAVGKFFIASVRGMDWVARFDAATFAFLLPNTAHAGALRVAERLRTTTLASGPTIGDVQVNLTLSLGTTESMLGDTSEAIIRRAEDAMNVSLQAGGNCIRSYVVGQFESAGVA